MPTSTQLELNMLEKAMVLNLKTFLRTGNEFYRDNYLYYMVEKERLLTQLLMPRMSDEEYCKLTIY